MILLHGSILVLAASTPPSGPAALPANYGTQLLSTLTIFLLVIGVLYFVAFVAIRRFKPRPFAAGGPGGAGGEIEVVAAKSLELGKTIYLIKFRGREWLVAATPQSCQTLAEVTPEPFRPAAPSVSSKPASAASPGQAPPAGERV
ncbi:MAG: flagellar biosynthetic protein FliO [Planctomycetota bacterium]|nr:flagellar biosynthetic protein FliO [Planctomycetota bacterium]